MNRFPRQVRWAAPAAVAATVVAVTAGSLVSVAQASPGLPARTPAQLLAAVARSSSPPPPLTGEVKETVSLGVPQIPGADSPSSLTSLLTGTHSLTVWYADPAHVRLSMRTPLGEADLIRNGTTAWLWQSAADSVTRFALPPRKGAPSAAAPAVGALTPQQAARRILALVGRSTRVSVARNLTVAGQPAYQLVLAPRDGRSLIGHVDLALDARHPQLPLRVQVFARGASRHPAFETGYTSLTFGRPAASLFRFTPPRGASVHVAAPTGPGATPAGPPTGQAGPLSGTPRVIGKGWLSVAVLPASALSALGHGNPAAAAGQAARSMSGAGADSGNISPAAIAGAVLRSARPVSGPWGSGRLLHTSLVNVLITDSGHVLVGAVVPKVLYAAAAMLP